MRGCVALFFTLALAAQQPAPEGVVRGTLLSWDSGPLGDLSVRTAGHRVFCFRFDRATAIERGGMRAGFADLRKGDTVEIVPERGPNQWLRRAHIVRVVASRAPGPALPREYRRSTELDDLFPRGNLLLAGVVAQLRPGRLLLRTRGNGNEQILLRDDTRYFGQGHETASSGLRVNTRVFVRAGRNFEDQIEAYQVMWGDILRPPGNERIGAAPQPSPPEGPHASQLY